VKGLIVQSRYKPVGWRNDSHRHYLAAKGIKSKYEAHKYFSDGEMHDERPFYQEHKLKSEGMNLRMHDIGKKHDEIMQKMEEEVKKGNLDPHKREEFFTGDFKKAKEDYLNKTYNTSQFHDEVDRSFTYFMKINDKNLRVFGWAKTDAPKKKREYDAETDESNMVGSGVI
jgi:hypothetical protein